MKTDWCLNPYSSGMKIELTFTLPTTRGLRLNPYSNGMSCYNISKNDATKIAIFRKTNKLFCFFFKPFKLCWLSWQEFVTGSSLTSFSFWCEKKTFYLSN
jgi:hypothetical protein